jgi:hypothetical protein
VPIPGATQSQYALTPQDYDQTITANIVCFDGSTVITDGFDVPFEPTAYTYWRASGDFGVSPWFNTDLSEAQFMSSAGGGYCGWSPGGDPPRSWFPGATFTVSGPCSIGGYLGGIFAVPLNPVPGSSNYPVRQWFGSVSPGNPYVVAPVTFEFGMDGVTVTNTWAGNID